MMHSEPANRYEQKINLVIGYFSSIGLPLSALFTELLWIYPWTAWLSILIYGSLLKDLTLNFLLISLLGLSALMLGRLLNSFKWPLIIQRLVVIAAGILLIISLLAWFFASEAAAFLEQPNPGHPLIFSFFAAALFWWRGLLKALPDYHIDDYRTSLPRGFLALVALVIILTIQSSGPFKSSITILQAVLNLHLISFFTIALITLGFNNLISLTVDRKNKTPLTRRWVAILFSIVLLLIITAVILAGVIPFGLWQNGLSLLEPLAEFIANLIVLILLVPLRYIGPLLDKAIAWLIARQPSWHTPSEELPGFGDLNLDHYTLRNIHPDATLAIQWILLSILLALILYLIIRSVFRVDTRKQSTVPDETSENLFSWKLLNRDFKSLLRRGKQSLDLAKRIRHLLQSKTVFTGNLLDIRSIYRAFLSKTSRLGWERYVWETPHDYMQRLKTSFPEISEPLHRLTEYYVAERYGEMKLTPDQVADARETLKKLKLSIVQND